MSELDSCDKKKKSICRHFKLSKNEELFVIALYCTAIVDAVFQILLLVVMTGFWILSIFARDLIAFGVVSGFALMGDTVCGLQLLLALLMLHACTKTKLKHVESSVLWIGVHLVFFIIIIFMGYKDMDNIVLNVILVYLLFRIIQIVLLLRVRNQILRRHKDKLPVDQSIACNLQYDLLISVGQEKTNDKIPF